MIATAGIPEVPAVPSGQVWARETGQWVPITPQTGVFLPLAGGAMTGNINMSGNTIQNMAAVPAMPNGAAPAQWVLNQIASVSLYQGTWDADNNVPDLTQLSTHVNAYTWIAITTSVSGVVIGPPIPGLQGMTIYNGDTIIFSTAQGRFSSIHAGGLTQPEADARYVQLTGSQMSGALLLNANASQPLQAVTFQQLQAFVPPGAVGEAPNDGQLYGRNGLTASWAPVLPLAGGILTGALTLAGNATANLNPVPLQQMTSAITAATAGLLPLAGGTMTGLMTLSGNASANLNPVPLQQLNSMLGTYALAANVLPITGGTLTAPGNIIYGPVNVPYQGSALFNVRPMPVGGPYTSWQYIAAGGAAQLAASATGFSINCFPAGTAGATASGQQTAAFTTTGITFQPNVTMDGQLLVDGGATVTGPSGIAGMAFSVSSTMTPAANNTGSVGVSGGAFFQMYSYAFDQASDPRSKKNLGAAPPGALAKILAIPVKNFHWLEEDESAPLHTGWDATDVQAALGDAPAVNVGTDAEKTLSLNMSEMTAWLWQAVQELAQKVSAA